jgi:predicted flap endonuclease-1-like 5' DNA nuclease
MWSEITKRWVDLFFWWVPKVGKPAESEKKAAAGAERPVERAAAEPSPRRPAAEPTAASRRAEAPQAEPKPEPPKAEARKAEPPKAEARKAEPDDLTTIKGIGPATQDKLRGLGIATFKDLAAADPDAVAQQLKGGQPISEAQVRGWTKEAGKRAKG